MTQVLEDITPLSVRTILDTAHQVETHVSAKLEEAGVSMAKLMALQALSSAGDALPLSQLAARLSCVKSNITQLVDRLEADGLVVRETDSRDRRTRLAVLTAEGRRVCDDGTRIQKIAEREFLSSLSTEEASRLATLLAKLRIRE